MSSIFIKSVFWFAESSRVLICWFVVYIKILIWSSIRSVFYLVDGVILHFSIRETSEMSETSEIFPILSVRVKKDVFGRGYALTGAVVAVPIYQLFSAAYSFGSNELPAPAAQVGLRRCFFDDSKCSLVVILLLMHLVTPLRSEWFSSSCCIGGVAPLLPHNLAQICQIQTDWWEK